MNGKSVVVTGIATALSGVDGPADLAGGRPARPGAADPADALTGRGLRYADRATKLALCAARDALESAGLLAGGAVPEESTGVVVSSNYGNVDTFCDTVDAITRDTYLGTSPMRLPATASNVTASAVAIRFRLRGANVTLCNGPTSGIDAVHWARVLVAASRVERVLVIGVEPANRQVESLSGVPGHDLMDGAAGLVVESEAAARSRRAEVLAELGPYSRRADWAESVATVLPGGPGQVDLWCTPGGVDPGPRAVVDAAAHLDVTRLLGECSGALGVVQCVAGTAWLADGGGTVLATAGRGAPDDDAASAITLSRAGGRR
ncbi:beta-ketoacyl synthase N-terminal-like domain-containing protein [Actinosynnema sp. NPDC050436]|uniref:beta-ketoacyl synthase N-terminal-like domain-containing protein n=1 Tax=Actinosynnema sp. NPDC050436 TaxID=3155659 RepID=UPI0033E5B3B5